MHGLALALLLGLPLGVGAGFVLGYEWVKWEEQKRESEDERQSRQEDAEEP